MSDPNAYKRQRMAERLNFEDRTKAFAHWQGRHAVSKKQHDDL